MDRTDDFDAWLETGWRHGWAGAPVCVSHDGMPTTEAEDDDPDLCVHIIRLYPDADTRAAVHANHAASNWRATNLGLPDATPPR
jgi:hypothetical protein